MNNKLLTEFYYGNINPNEKQFIRGSDYEKTAKRLCKFEEQLVSRLDSESKTLFESLVKEQMELNGLTAEENFIYGFKLGMRMAMEVLCDESDNVKPIIE